MMTSVFQYERSERKFKDNDNINKNTGTKLKTPAFSNEHVEQIKFLYVGCLTKHEAKWIERNSGLAIAIANLVLLAIGYIILVLTRESLGSKIAVVVAFLIVPPLLALISALICCILSNKIRRKRLHILLTDIEKLSKKAFFLNGETEITSSYDIEKMLLTIKTQQITAGSDYSLKENNIMTNKTPLENTRLKTSDSRGSHWTLSSMKPRESVGLSPVTINKPSIFMNKECLSKVCMNDHEYGSAEDCVEDRVKALEYTSKKQPSPFYGR